VHWIIIYVLESVTARTKRDHTDGILYDHNMRWEVITNLILFTRLAYTLHPFRRLTLMPHSGGDARVFRT